MSLLSPVCAIGASCDTIARLTAAAGLAVVTLGGGGDGGGGDVGGGEGGGGGHGGGGDVGGDGGGGDGAAADLAVAETVVAPTTVNRDFRNISAQTFSFYFIVFSKG